MTAPSPAPAYGLRKATTLTYDAAVSAVRDALKSQGFGVLTEIDMQAAIKEKLGEDIEPQVILGVCNPPLAFRALTAEPSIGLLLPCNVVVRVQDGATLVEAMDPKAALGIVDNPAVTEVANEARQRLAAALDLLP